MVCVISISLIQNTHAQTIPEQGSLSGDLKNDPVAQDILKKIEQTKKMIEELKQKEYENNQAKENLEKMRNMSIESLNKRLVEWERLWENYSSENSFERFANEKPSYVQGVFWDQFQFKEQRVDAGRAAMNTVLSNGGTISNANIAYYDAASIQIIELIEMNSQFNVKHNLADYAEQQVFNSTGQVHSSPAIYKNLASIYSDYEEQPIYILANYGDEGISAIGPDMSCKEGFVLVSRVVSGNSSCVAEGLAEKWADEKIPGIVVSGNPPQPVPIKTNPGTQCEEGHVVVYHITASEYQCVLESAAKEMTDTRTGEIHTLVEYILDKDDQKIIADETYEINHEIRKLQTEYDLKRNTLESKYEDRLENENSIAKQKMQDIIEGYGADENITKEEVSRLILEIREISNHNKEKINQERLDEITELDLALKKSILKIIKGHENNSQINVDWDFLNGKSVTEPMAIETRQTIPVKVSSLNENDASKIHLDNFDLVNSFGYALDEIRSEQVLHIVSDITNTASDPQNFIYMVEIKDHTNSVVQPAKWMTGVLNSNQTFNAGLSWIPKETGKYTATVSTGTGMNSVLQMADIEINVNPDGNASDDNYCKNGHELLFKYVDNSPVCATPNTASKLIDKGLAFA